MQAGRSVGWPCGGQYGVAHRAGAVGQQHPEQRDGKYSIAGAAAENEASVPGVGSKPMHSAADADRPGARDGRADIFYTRHGKTRPPKHIFILRLFAEPGQPPLLADRLKEIADVPWAWGAVREPSANDQSSSGAQSAESLSEASYFVVHMLGALDRIGPVEDGGGKPIGEPISHLERQGASGGDAPRCACMLHGGERNADDRHDMRVGKRLRRCAVTAANIADYVAWREIEPSGDPLDQRNGGILGSLVAGPSVVVVHVLTPDLAIELIERVVMCCHIPRGLFAGVDRSSGLRGASSCAGDPLQSPTTRRHRNPTRPGYAASASSRIWRKDVVVPIRFRQKPASLGRLR